MRIAVILILILLSISAAEAAEITGGARELTISGNTTHQRSDAIDVSSTAFSFGLARFLGPRLGIRISSTLALSSVEVDGQKLDASVYSFDGGLVWNLRSSGDSLPYVAASVGSVIPGGDAAGDELGMILPRVAAGIRAAVSSGAFVVVESFYERRTKLAGIDGNSGNVFGVSIGLSLLLGE